MKSRNLLVLPALLDHASQSERRFTGAALLCALLLALAAVVGFMLSGPAAAQLACAPSAADQAHVCWVNATRLVDANGNDAGPIPTTGPDALKETRVFMGSCDAAGNFGTAIGAAIVKPFPATDHLFTGLAPGVYCFRARHVTNGGVFSNFSGTGSKNIATPPPKKSAGPSGLTVA